MNREIEISPYGSLLVYKKGYTVDFVRAVIEERQLRGLRIFAHTKDDRLNDLNFLKEYSFLEVLDIASVDDYNYGFLSSLKKLKELTIATEGENVIDLSDQHHLETLTIQWRKGKILGLGELKKITSLCLIDFREKDFLPIIQLNNLRNLSVKTASIKSLEGIRSFTNMKGLLLGNCKSLAEINDIVGLQLLTSLNIELCPRIRDYNPIGEIVTLKTLQITDCKNVNTIQFLRNLPLLEKFMFLGNSNVVDGDIIPAKDIKDVVYKHRNHYNIKIEQKSSSDLVDSNLKKIKKMF